MPLPVVLVPLMSGVLGAIGAFIAKVLSVETLKFIAWRAFILFLFYVATPILLYNIGIDFVFDLLQAGMDYAGGLEQGEITIQLTGMAGYIAQTIRLPEAFAMYMAAIATKFIMGFIPGLR